MSRSYRSQKEGVIAQRRVERAADGRVVLPRVIERAPAPGDTHPLTKPIVRRLMSRLPVEYVHGLSRVELRAREGALVGRPYGEYWRDERAIVLYSLPPVLHFKSLSCSQILEFDRFCADLQFGKQGDTVSWRHPNLRMMWFYCCVFTHELGHHHAEQYRFRNGRVRSRDAGEMMADLHARRLTSLLLGPPGREGQATSADAGTSATTAS